MRLLNLSHAMLDPAGVVRPVAEALASRPLRVVALTAVSILLSLADLAMTLEHMLGVGLLEQNPLARSLANWGDAYALIGLKVASVAVFVSIAIGLRKRVQGEILAWIVAAMLIGLMLQWTGYNASVHQITPYLGHFQADPPAAWVTLAR